MEEWLKKMYMYIYTYMCVCIYIYMGFPSGSAVKNPPAMQEMQVRSLGWEDTLEESKTTDSSIFAWRIPWTEEAGGLQFIGSQKQT